MYLLCVNQRELAGLAKIKIQSRMRACECEHVFQVLCVCLKGELINGNFLHTDSGYGLWPC